MKSLSIFSSLNNSNSLNLSELMNKSTMFLYDLRPTKVLNDSNGETYKTLLSYMKNNNMTINLENLLKLIQDFNTVYNKKIVKTKHAKKINVISELYLREKIISFFKNTLISYGFCVYYLTKAPIFSDNNTILNKRNIIIFSIIILALIVGFIYTHSKNKNHSIEVFNRVENLEKILKSFNTNDKDSKDSKDSKENKENKEKYELEQIIINNTTLNSNIYHDLLYDMLSDMYVKVENVRNIIAIQINQETMQPFNIIDDNVSNNGEGKIYEIRDDNQEDIIMSEINQDNIFINNKEDKEDVEEMLEIIMSPQEELEERIEHKLENIENKIEHLEHKSDSKSEHKSEEDKKIEKIQQEEITLDEKVNLDNLTQEENQEPIKIPQQVKPGRKPRSSPVKNTKQPTKQTTKQVGRKPKNVKK
jgi:hypothetical protein